MRRLQLLLLAIGFGLLFLATAAHAQTQQDKAESSAITDTAQTLFAVGSGIAAEANPLGVAAGLLKYPLLKYCESLPKYEQPECFASLNIPWSMAVANNWCVLGAVVTGLIPLAPLCPMFGAAWSMNEMSKSQAELEFWAICRTAAKEYDEAHPDGPAFTCTYTPPVEPVREPILAADIPRVSE